MNELFLLLIIVSCVLGAIFARMDGGGIVKTPEAVERALCMSFFILACVPSAGFLSVLALLGTFGIATGHGQYFPTCVKQTVKPEFFDFLVRPFFGEDPRNQLLPYSDSLLYMRNAFGMFVTGSIVGLPAALLCIATGNFYGIAMLFTGVAKTLGYHLGFKLTGRTEAGEYLNGALRTLLCMITFIGGL